MSTRTSKKIVLIVEDDLSLLHAIDDKLKRSGYDTFMVSQVDQAIERLNILPKIDAVWLDHYLPIKTGDELVIYMKQKGSAFQGIPIFLISNTASTEKVYNYMQLGVIKYFVKADRRLDEIIVDITNFLKKKNL